MADVMKVGDFELVGFEGLKKQLQELPLKLARKVLVKAIREAGKPVLARAKQNAPVGKESASVNRVLKNTAKLGKALGATDKQIAKATSRVSKQMKSEAKKAGKHYAGQLRDSLKLRSIKRNKEGSVGVRVQTAEGDYRGEEFYGAFVEYGTSKQAGEPYLRPALDTEKTNAVSIVASSIRVNLDSLMRQS